MARIHQTVHVPKGVPLHVDVTVTTNSGAARKSTPPKERKSQQAPTSQTSSNAAQTSGGTQASSQKSDPNKASDAGGDKDYNDMAKMLADNKQDQLKMFALQQTANRDSLHATTMSSIAKASHDAMMAIASNIK